MFKRIQFFLGLQLLASSINAFGVESIPDVHGKIKIWQQEKSKAINFSAKYLPKPSTTIERLQSGKFGKVEGFKSFSKLRWSLEPETRVTDLQTLDWKIEPNGKYFLLQPEFKDQFKSLRNYNELWVDYSILEGDLTCNPQVSLNIKGKSAEKFGNKPSAVENWEGYSISFVPSASSASSVPSVPPLGLRTHHDISDTTPWVKKDYGYLLARTIGLKPDGLWRYKKSSGGLVAIQKRMHWPIDVSSFLLVNHIKTINLTGMNVRIGFGNTYRDDKSIAIPVPASHLLPNGNHGFIIDLGRVIAENFPKQSIHKIPQAFLQEIYFHFPGTVEHSLKIKPLHSIELFNTPEVLRQVPLPNPSTEDQGIKNFIKLSGNIKKLRGQQLERLVVNLSPMTDKLTEEIITHGTLNFLFPSNQCKVNSIRLASTYQTKRPSYITAIENWNRHYGGPFLDDTPQMDTVEGVVFLARWSPPLFSPSVKSDKKNSPIELTPYRLTEDSIDNKLPVMGNLKILGNTDWGGILSDKGVLMHGKSKEVSLLLPAQITLDENSVFFASIPEGKNNISRAQLQLTGSRGEIWQREIAINQALSLNDAPTNIVSAVLQFSFYEKFFIEGYAYRFNAKDENEKEPSKKLVPLNLLPGKEIGYEFILGEITFASPRKISYEKALTIKFPWQGKQVLRAKKVSKGVLVKNIPPDKNKNFWFGNIREGQIEMVAPNPVLWMESMHLSYKLPKKWLKKDKCVLTGEFIFSEGVEHRTFCLNQVSGTKDFSAVGLGLSHHKYLKKIIWHIQKPEVDSGLATIETSVSGQWMISVLQQTQNTPLTYLDSKSYFMSGTKSLSMLSKMSSNSSFWVELTPPFLADYVEKYYNSSLSMLDSPWIQVDEIAVESRAGMKLKEWIRLTKPENPKISSRSFNFKYLLSLLLVFGTIFFIKPKGRRSMTQRRIINTIKVVLLEFPRTMAHHIFLLGLRLARWMNLFLGIIFFPLLLWSINSLNDAIFLDKLLATLIFTVSGIHIYRHWRRFGPWAENSIKILWAPFSWAAFFFSVIGVLVSATIHLNHSNLWYWVIIFVASLYGVIPELVHRLRKCSKEFLLIVSWGTVSLILYVYKVMQPISANGDYIIFLGPMSAVLCWASFAGWAKPYMLLNWPALAKNIYSGAGTHYFLGVVAIIMCVIPMLMLRLEPIANQLAMIGYYMLAFGLVLETRTLLQQDKSGNWQKS